MNLKLQWINTGLSEKGQLLVSIQGLEKCFGMRPWEK